MKQLRLIYTSFAATDVSWNTVKSIMETSKANNERRGLTGLLVYSEGKFLQVLEGLADEVNTLYETIQHDERHHTIRTLYVGEIAERHFTRWSMRGVHVEGLPEHERAALYRKYEPTGKGVVIPEDPFKAYALLYDIASRPSVTSPLA